MRHAAFWVLKDGQPVIEPDLGKFGTWFEDIENRRIAEDVVGAYRVSTVFLGIDHDMHGTSPAPILFETMIFGPDSDCFRQRYTSLEASKLGHKAAVLQVRAQVLDEGHD